MGGRRRYFADSAPVSRSVRLDVDIVLPDEAARIQLDRLVVPHTTPEQSRAAGITLCAAGSRRWAAVAGLDLDVRDPRQLEAAAIFVRPALEALGIAAPHEQPDAHQEQGAEREQCGDVAAYRRHRRRGEKPCEACRIAYNAHERALYVPVPRKHQPCGTPTAYKRHYKRGEKACQPCRDAHNAYERARRKAKRQAR
jgi:hypothetical protein